MQYRPFIEILPNVSLRPPDLKMAESLFETIQENFTHLSRFLDFITEDLTVDAEKSYLKMMIQHQAESKGQLFLIYYEDELIGTIDLHKIDLKNKKAEIGYWMAKGYTGKRIATESVVFICHYAFEILELNKLTIIVDVRNIASNKVAKNAGFHFVATDIQDMYDGENYQDMNRYILLKNHFDLAESH